MNPWQALRSEINGAVRSIRYDIAARRARRLMNEATVTLPVISSSAGPARRRVVLAVGVILAPVVGFSGYAATADSWGALFPGGGTPSGLPEVAAGSPPRSPVPVTSPDRAVPARRQPPSTARTGGPDDPAGGVARPRPTGTPPVPTPAPSCGCVTHSPSPTASPSPSPTPSPNPTVSPVPSPSPITSATSGHSPGVRR